MESSVEIWLPVAGYEATYSISNTGKVKSIRRNKTLNPFRDPDGYHRVNLSDDNRRAKRSVHRLVGAAFKPNPEKLPEINHLDGDKSNNNDWNLEWSSQLNNLKHQHEVLGVNYAKGERITSSKLKSNDVLQIIELLKNGMSQSKIGAIYNVRQTTIGKINLGQRWSHLTGKVNKSNHH